MTNLSSDTKPHFDRREGDELAGGLGWGGGGGGHRSCFPLISINSVLHFLSPQVFIANVTHATQSGLRQIIIEVQVNGLEIGIIIHAQLIEFLIIICDAIVFQCFGHVEVALVILPGVAGSMSIVLEVSVTNLSHDFFRTHLEQTHGKKIYIS